MAQVHKFYSEDLSLRVSAAITTEVVREMAAKQKTFPVPTIVAGQALTGALLMASQLKAGQRVGLHFKGNGPLGLVYTEASYECEVRGFCANPKTDVRTADGHLDLARAMGSGILTVTRSMPFQKQPHVGIVPLVSGEVSQNLAHYLFQSHQIPSVVSLTVSLDRDGQILAAGGVLIEVMPGISENLLATLERRSREAGPLSRRIQNGESLMALASSYTHGSPLVEVTHPHPIIYSCRCEAERAQKAIAFLGRATVTDMVLKGADVAVTCEFCGQTYIVTVDELKLLLEPDSTIH